MPISFCNKTTRHVARIAVAMLAAPGSVVSARADARPASPTPVQASVVETQGARSIDPQVTHDMCVGYLSSDVDPMEARNVRFSTWTVYDDGADVKTILARAKANLGSELGLRVVGESQSASRGRLDLMVTRPEPFLSKGLTRGALNVEPFPMRFEVDTSLGIMVVTMRPGLGQDVSELAAAPAVCRLVSAAANLPAPILDIKEYKLMDGAKEAFEAAWHAFMSRARKSGKALVVMPAMDVHEKYQRYGGSGDELPIDDYIRETTATSIWQHRDHPDAYFESGFMASRASRGLHGGLYVPTKAHARYMMYLLDPGTYDLAGLVVDERHADLPRPEKEGSGASALGTVVATKRLVDGFTTVSEWHDPTYRQEFSDQAYCALVEAASGRCLQWGSDRVSSVRRTSAGGYVDTVKDVHQANVTLSANLAKPAASFTVAQGDFVLLDGIVPRNVYLDLKSCKEQAKSGAVTCGLAGATFWRVTGSVTDLKSGMQSMSAAEAVTAKELTPQQVRLSPSLIPTDVPADAWESGRASNYTLKAK